MILDNDTLLKYITISSTSIHGVTRHDTVSRQTLVWQIPKVCAILVSLLDQYLRHQPSNDLKCAYGDVLRLPCSYTVSALNTVIEPVLD